MEVPEYGDWMLLDDAKCKKEGPRMDTYTTFLNYVVWPSTGAMMRRLDDGAWNLNRFKERQGVPGVTKEQLEKVKAKY